MNTKGFELLNDIQRKAKCLCSTLEERKKLYENHDKYAGIFKGKHQLANWISEDVFQAIQADLKEFIITDAVEDRVQLLYIAAACGEIFVAHGGKWKWEKIGDDGKAIAVIPNRNPNTNSVQKEITMEPLDLIYKYIDAEYRENVCVWIAGVLQYCNIS